MRQPLQAQFVLNISGEPSDDFYTICGRCAGDSADPSKETWRCGEGERAGMNGKVVIHYDLFKYCLFHWKWRNQADNSGYEPPNNGHDDNDKDNERIFLAGDGVCQEQEHIQAVVTKWGEMLSNHNSQTDNGICAA